MGILNVTPDSFFDGGRHVDLESAVARGLAMVAEGATVVDVGGESTRPGADPVPELEERRRVLEVVAALAPHVRVSIDTKKARVAEAAIEAGATIVNDVTASLEKVAASGGAGWVAMHSRGDPRTMAKLTDYADVVGDVRTYLAAAARRARDAGVTEVWVDPGIGFAKTAGQNYLLLARLHELVGDGTPVLVGASRKSFLAGLPVWPAEGRARPITGSEPSFRSDRPAPLSPQERAEASLAVATWAMWEGAAVVRVHDVAPTVAAAALVGPGRRTRVGHCGAGLPTEASPTGPGASRGAARLPGGGG